jgi:hypothetical protein
MVARFPVQWLATEAACERAISTLEGLFPRSRLSARDNLIISQLTIRFYGLWHTLQLTIVMGTSPSSEGLKLPCENIMVMYLVICQRLCTTAVAGPSQSHDRICPSLGLAMTEPGRAAMPPRSAISREKCRDAHIWLRDNVAAIESVRVLWV